MLTNLTSHDESSDELNRGQERAGQFIVARGDGSELLELAHKPFHTVPASVEFFVVRNLLHAITPGWNHGLNLLFSQLVTDLVAVIGFIHDRRLNRATLRHNRENGVQDGSIVLLAGGQHEGKGSFFIRGRQVELGAETASAAAQALLGLPPFSFVAPAACW